MPQYHSCLVGIRTPMQLLRQETRGFFLVQWILGHGSGSRNSRTPGMGTEDFSIPSKTVACRPDFIVRSYLPRRKKGLWLSGPHFMPARTGTKPHAVGGTISKMLLGGLLHSGVCPAQKAVKARNSLTKPLLILPHTPRRGPLAHASGAHTIEL